MISRSPNASVVCNSLAKLSAESTMVHQKLQVCARHSHLDTFLGRLTEAGTRYNEVHTRG